MPNQDKVGAFFCVELLDFKPCTEGKIIFSQL